MSFRILFTSDGHAGYSSGSKTDPKTGLNLRVQDGYLALKAVVDLALELRPDLVVFGGDEFHDSWPTVNDIKWVLNQLRRLSKAGIRVIVNTGNHDATKEKGRAHATAVLHDPARNIHVVTEPNRVFEPVPGLVLHVVSHAGLDPDSPPLEIKPVDGSVNVATAHGAAAVPGHEVFRCIDTPEERSIGLDILADPSIAAWMLGHYHGMGPLPGLPHAWYAGSLLRRGFADPEGGRGALLYTVNTDGTVNVDRHFIEQRAQHDLPLIDAAGLTGADVEERIRANLEAVDLHEAIVRQRVVNCPLSVKRGIDHAVLSRLTAGTLIWKPEYDRPDEVHEPAPGQPLDPAVTDEDGVAGQDRLNGPDGKHDDPAATRRRFGGGTARLPETYRQWSAGWQPTMASELREKAIEQAERHLRAVTRGADSGEDDVARPGMDGVAASTPQTRAAAKARRDEPDGRKDRAGGEDAA